MSISTSASSLALPVSRSTCFPAIRRRISRRSLIKSKISRESANAVRALSNREGADLRKEEAIKNTQEKPETSLLNTFSTCLVASNLFPSEALASNLPLHTTNILLMDLDPNMAKLAIGIIGPFLSAYGFLFIVRIVMSWYPKLQVGEFPYVLAYAPTEPLLVLTRKVIPPLGGVDVTPVVWFGLLSFLNEILVGPQGLLVLLSQQV